MNASVDGTPGISSWSTGHKDESGHAGSWLDAANGLLDEAPSAFGSIFGAIAADSPTIGAGSTAVVHTWLAAGKNLQQVRFLDSIVRRRGPQYFMDRTLHYWRAWVNKEDLAFANLPPEVVRMYKRSLLILRTQVDNGGGITAANDSDYTYLSPRPRDLLIRMAEGWCVHRQRAGQGRLRLFGHSILRVLQSGHLLRDRPSTRRHASRKGVHAAQVHP